MYQVYFAESSQKPKTAPATIITVKIPTKILSVICIPPAHLLILFYQPEVFLHS